MAIVEQLTNETVLTGLAIVLQEWPLYRKLQYTGANVALAGGAGSVGQISKRLSPSLRAIRPPKPLRRTRARSRSRGEFYFRIRVRGGGRLLAGPGRGQSPSALLVWLGLREWQRPYLLRQRL